MISKGFEAALKRWRSSEIYKRLHDGTPNIKRVVIPKELERMRGGAIKKARYLKELEKCKQEYKRLYGVEPHDHDEIPPEMIQRIKEAVEKC